MGFKRSEKRMKQLEGLLREGMARHGISGETADRIVLSITSFALYGFPESHAASFALIAYTDFQTHASEKRCPKCGCDDASMIEQGSGIGDQGSGCFCNICSHAWIPASIPAGRFRSIDDLVRRVNLRRDEIAMLAEIGALNSLGHDRRSAMWQVERAIRPAGELFESSQYPVDGSQESPLDEMNISERLIADYTGTGLTVGPHPLTFRRQELAMRGIVPAIELPRVRQGRRVRTAGMVITRQRPGTAKGFVFLTLEDETGISNIIIRPDLYAKDRLTVVESSFLIVEGILQNQDGVTSIKAERMSKLSGMPDEAAIDSHDFH
jgi:error-prone DNA polymerase